MSDDRTEITALVDAIVQEITERRAAYITPEAADNMYQRGVAYGLDVARTIVQRAANRVGA